MDDTTTRCAVRVILILRSSVKSIGINVRAIRDTKCFDVKAFLWIVIWLMFVGQLFSVVFMLFSPTKVTIWKIMRAKRATNEFLSYCYPKEIGILSDLTLSKIEN